MSTRYNTVGLGLVLWLVLASSYLLYSPGITGSFHFDDAVNLSGLSGVQDYESALTFVASGNAGELSRPIALASFLLNLGDWPTEPKGFLKVNVLIHTLNGALLAWLAVRLFRLVGVRGDFDVALVAFTAASLWLFTPLLASTSLLVIQRMTSLSALFVLAGLLLYIAGLSNESFGRRVIGRALQFSGIAVGTLLATLSKENGALLPLFALILEVTVLAGNRELAATRRWRLIFLCIPVLVLFSYLSFRVSPAAFSAREFTLSERLMTQPLVLLDYLRLALIPRPTAFTPFHDDFPVVRNLISMPIALIATAVWGMILSLALWQRNRYPWFSFAALWFLSAHLLESTALPLELYFEHRNYVPWIGPTIAISWFVWKTAEPWRHVVAPLFGGYILLSALVLWQTTNLWGNPIVAASIWAADRPHSIRAQQYLAQRYDLRGDPTTALAILGEATRQNPLRVDLALQVIEKSCSLGLDESIGPAIDDALGRADTAPLSSATFDAITGLIELKTEGHCKTLTSEDLKHIINVLLDNPVYQAPRNRHYLHHLKARLAIEEGNFNDTMVNLEKAFDTQPNIETLAMIVGTLLSGGLQQDAIAFLESSRKQTPKNPILRGKWIEMDRQLRDQIISSKAPAE